MRFAIAILITMLAVASAQEGRTPAQVIADEVDGTVILDYGRNIAIRTNTDTVGIEAGLRRAVEHLGDNVDVTVRFHQRKEAYTIANGTVTRIRSDEDIAENLAPPPTPDTDATPIIDHARQLADLLEGTVLSAFGDRITLRTDLTDTEIEQALKPGAPLLANDASFILGFHGRDLRYEFTNGQAAFLPPPELPPLGPRPARRVPRDSITCESGPRSTRCYRYGELTYESTCTENRFGRVTCRSTYY